MNRLVKIALVIAAILVAWILYGRMMVSRARGAVPTSQGPTRAWWQDALVRLSGSPDVQRGVASGAGKALDLFQGWFGPRVPAEDSGHPAWDVVPESDYGAGD